MKVRVGSVNRFGRRPLIAEPSQRLVGWAHWDSGPILLGALDLDEVRKRLGPRDRFDDPERPNRNRCPEGHWYDEALAGACPWCPEGA